MKTKRGYEYRGHMTGEASGDDRCPHGSVNGYVNFRCRCVPCRGAWRDYIAARRQRAKDAPLQEA